mgnify:CR=1 FL=1
MYWKIKNQIVTKAQKHFLRLVLIKGLNAACNEITEWRAELIREEMLNLLR